MIKGLIVIWLFVATDAAVIFLYEPEQPIIPNYVPSDRYYYPWSPYYYLGAVGADNTRIDYLSPHHYEVGGQIAESSYTEGRNGGAGDDSRQDLGEETIPNYRFFQWVLKTVKKMRKHFIPLYVTTPDDISSIYNNFKRAR